MGKKGTRAPKVPMGRHVQENSRKKVHHEQPKAGANGIHSHNIRQNDVNRISSPSDKTHTRFPWFHQKSVALVG
jgi:hypothetical protein